MRKKSACFSYRHDICSLHQRSKSPESHNKETFWSYVMILYEERVYLCNTWAQFWSSRSPAGIVTWSGVSKKQTDVSVSKRVTRSFNNHHLCMFLPLYAVLYWPVAVAAERRDWPLAPGLPAADAEVVALPVPDAERHDVSSQPSSPHQQSYESSRRASLPSSVHKKKTLNLQTNFYHGGIFI